jgi:Helicase conserved C-terminal domain
MTATQAQAFAEACERFVGWLDARVTAAGRGDDTERLDVDPSATFWLGRLASEEWVRRSDLGDRVERLDPCAIGLRMKPSGPGPWTLTARVELRAWVKDGPDGPEPKRRWWQTEPVDRVMDISFSGDQGVVSAGRRELAEALADVGVSGLEAEVRVEVEQWQGRPEIVVQLVNVSPPSVAGLADTHLYRARLTVSGLDVVPFQLEALPDSFRYDRGVPAYGINVGVESVGADPSALRTTDTITVDTSRSDYWNSPHPEPDLSFTRLARDPIPPLTALVDALDAWAQEHWDSAALREQAVRSQWSAAMYEEAKAAAADAAAEVQRLRRGLALLSDDPLLRRAFQLMNRAIDYSTAGKFPGWRPFQIGYLLGAITFLSADVDGQGDAERDIVDTVWFATGGGKTETYLGLLVTAALHDRLAGKTSGISAWARFPLRLLSLQQTQRFADALGGAERVRREESIGGSPLSMGFFVGKGGTPNKIVKDSDGNDPDPESPGMPDSYQVLLRCPFCRAVGLGMRFDRRQWRLVHECPNDDCPWPERSLPFYIVDQEIYRFLPTVVLGTLDKAASIGLQAAMRGLVGPPLGLCSEHMHGYIYAPRAARPNGCLVPDCKGGRKDLPMPRERFAPTLRLQDELHLLRDSLGAVDSHYESLLDHLQYRLTGSRAKVVASSATLSGHDRQVDVLYRRTGRVFPQPGPSVHESFWTRRTHEPLRRFVAVAPRGVTLEHVSDRTVSVLQESVRLLHTDGTAVCAEAGIDPTHATKLLSMYGTDVIYGTTLYDVEAAERSLTSNNTAGSLNSEQLTGQTDFEDVRKVLHRLENPEPAFEDRIHVVAASSMLSHGVDVERLNVMVMLGLPLSSAEFIQTSARVGRTHPGLVHVLHKIGRERDGQTFRHFRHYVTHGDRFVEPIPITRRSRRVLKLTMPGIVEARRLHLMEPASAKKNLALVRSMREHVRDAAITPADQVAEIARLLGFDGDVDELLREEIRVWMGTWFTNLEDPATTTPWSSALGPTTPMYSLRDVEASAPIWMGRPS